MNLLNKLERKFGKYAIKNLMFYIILLNGAFFILTQFDGNIQYLLRLDTYSILHGQVWRLITFVFLPPESSVIFIFFVLYFYYIVGTALESEWGSFKFNIYYLVGMLGTIIGAFIVGRDGSALYLNLSLFLAFAAIFPDYQILLFFILPIKVKYLGYLQWFFLAYTIITNPMEVKVAAIVSILNYLLFFGKDLFKKTSMKKTVYTNRKNHDYNTSKVIPFHKCTICGITDSDDPLMEFRFCSKCHGRHEYCAKHLTTHNHLSE